MEEALNYDLLIAISRLVAERPEWRKYFEEMVKWEAAHPIDPSNPWHNAGWEWQDVHCGASIINSLIAMGMVNVVSKSRTYTHYRLASLRETKEALDSWELRGEKLPEVGVDSLFDMVVGHERVKQLLRYAVKADGPVHCLLVGAVGTAKTLLLSELGHLPGAEFYAGSTTTKSGLVGLLLEKRPKFLVLDELDKMEAKDMSPLLNLMETGTVTRLLHGIQARMQMDTRVFGGANELRRISPAIISRFAVCEFRPYTPDEFVEVAKEVLGRRYGQGPEMALHIAAEVVKHSTDIRDAVRVARMGRGDPRAVVEVVRCLWGKPKVGLVTPMLVGSGEGRK